MRILCFIGNLGSGGAQRQLVNLAIGLQKRGEEVSFLLYGESDFYRSVLEENHIPIKIINPPSHLKRLVACRRYIRKGGFEAVIAFLETPSFIAEIAALPFKRWKLVVGERSANPHILKSFKKRFFRFFHLFADYVVANSNANKRLIQRVNPLLRKSRNKTIYNIYNLDKLNSNLYSRQKANDGKFHLLVAASHQRLKNFPALAKALSLLDEEQRNRIAVDWYGNQVKPCYDENLAYVSKYGLSDIVHFYPPTLEIYQKMVDADAVGLFSLYEGLSNTICEAMCLEKPVIATDVSDNKELIQTEGLICDAQEPTSIARSLRYLLDLSQADIDDIGKQNRRQAERLFVAEKIIIQYKQLMQ